MSTVKEELTQLIQGQPEDSTREEIVRELALHVMVERGLADSDAKRTISNDEMQRRSVGTRTGREMGHLAQNGPGGMLEVLEQLPRQRKVLIHINNTNPILDEDSAERAELVRRKVEVAYDGMSIEL